MPHTLVRCVEDKSSNTAAPNRHTSSLHGVRLTASSRLHTGTPKLADYEWCRCASTDRQLLLLIRHCAAAAAAAFAAAAAAAVLRDCLTMPGCPMCVGPLAQQPVMSTAGVLILVTHLMTPQSAG